MNGGRRGEGVIGCNALTVDSFSLQLPFSLHLDCSISSVAAICIRSCSCARTLCCLLSARVLSVSPIRLFKPNNATVRNSSNSSKKGYSTPSQHRNQPARTITLPFHLHAPSTLSVASPPITSLHPISSHPGNKAHRPLLPPILHSATPHLPFPAFPQSQSSNREREEAHSLDQDPVVVSSAQSSHPCPIFHLIEGPWLALSLLLCLRLRLRPSAVFTVQAQALPVPLRERYLTLPAKVIRECLPLPLA